MQVENSLEWVEEPWRALIFHASNTRDRWRTPGNFEFFNALSGLYSKFDDAYRDAIEEKYATDQVQGRYSSGDMLFARTIEKLLKISLNWNSLICYHFFFHLTFFFISRYFLKIDIKTTVNNVM